MLTATWNSDVIKHRPVGCLFSGRILGLLSSIRNLTAYKMIGAVQIGNEPDATSSSTTHLLGRDSVSPTSVRRHHRLRPVLSFLGQRRCGDRTDRKPREPLTPITLSRAEAVGRPPEQPTGLLCVHCCLRWSREFRGPWCAMPPVGIAEFSQHPASMSHDTGSIGERGGPWRHIRPAGARHRPP